VKKITFNQIFAKKKIETFQIKVKYAEYREHPVSLKFLFACRSIIINTLYTVALITFYVNNV